MKKYLIYFFLGIILISAGLYAYLKWFSDQSKTTWELVPVNAFAVYETSNLALIWNDFSKTDLWNNLSKIPSFKKKESNIIWLDSLMGASGQLDQLTRQSDVVVSLHQISKTDFDAIFLLPLKTPEGLAILTKALDKVRNNKLFHYSEREYQGYTIREFTRTLDNSIFSFMTIDENFVGSFTPFLIEDVVRNVSNDRNFQNTNQNLFQVSRLNNDKGNLYINYANFARFFENLFSNKNNQFVKGMEALLANGFLDVTFDDKNIFLNGFSFSGSDTLFLQTFSDATPSESGVHTLVPGQTALLYQLEIGNGEDWMENLSKYWRRRKEASGDWEELQNKFNFQTKRFFGWLGDGVSLCLLEPINIQAEEEIVFLETKDINEALNQMNTLAEKANRVISDTLYFEDFSDHRIIQLNIPNFPRKIFGSAFTGFDEVFYMPLDNYLVISNSIDNLKSLIIDIESENTWGKSIAHTKFLSSTLEKFNVSLIVDVPRILDLLYANSSPSFQKFLGANSKTIKTFGKASIQFRNQGDEFLTSLSIENNGRSTNPINEIDFESIQTVDIEKRITTKPQVVRNHMNSTLEVLVQDADKMLTLISSQGEILWKDTLEGKIRGEIEQIDFFKNNKLQYLFCTGRKMHLIDRNGEEVEGFPFDLNFDAFNWKLIDYDRSKNYRILISDFQGNLYLYDKTGNSLEGWNPRSLEGRLGVEPFHIRVRGRDAIVAVQENGIINVLNRRGEMFKGFPLDLKGRSNNQLFVQQGADLTSTVLTTITNEGEIVKFNLVGKILDRDQLFKPSAVTTFKQVVEKLGRTFVIVQQDGGRMSMLNKNGVLLFEKDYLSSSSLEAQYYDFGAGKKLYIVTDPLQEFTYIYQEDGSLVNSRPLESGFPVGILYYEGLQKFLVYSVFMDGFHISGFYTH